MRHVQRNPINDNAGKMKGGKTSYKVFQAY